MTDDALRKAARELLRVWDEPSTVAERVRAIEFLRAALSTQPTQPGHDHAKARQEPTREQALAWESESGLEQAYIDNEYAGPPYQVTHRFAALAYAAGIAAGEQDAKRWRALLNSARIRIIGCAGFEGDKGNYRHVGLEIWTEHPSSDGTEYGRKILTEYADAAMRAKEPK